MEVNQASAAGPPATRVRPAPPRRRLSAWRECGWLALLLATAAVVHATLTPEHFRERTLYGVFFLTAAIAQGSIAVALARSRTLSPLVYRVALWGSLAIVALWIVTRAVAPPLASAPEEVDIAGAVATAAELAVIVGLAVIGPPSRATGSARRRFPAGWGVLAGLAFALLFALASSTLVYADTALPEDVAVPSAAMYGHAIGPQSPWITVVLTRHLYINGAAPTLAFLVLGSGLLAVGVGLAVALGRTASACRAERTGCFSLLPAFLVVPSCCAAPVVAALGAGVAAPLVAAAPWILAATSTLLLTQVVVLWRRYRSVVRQEH